MGPGRVRVLCIPGPNPTRIHIILKNVQNPSSINTLFFFQISFFSATPLSLSLKLSPPATLLRSQTLPSLSRLHSASQPHSLVLPHAPLIASLHLVAPYLSHSHSCFFLVAPHPVMSLSFTHQPTLHSHHVVVVVLSTDLVVVEVWHRGARDCLIRAQELYWSIGLLDQRDQMIGGRDCILCLWFAFYIYIYIYYEWKIYINKEKPKKQVDLCVCVCFFFCFFIFIFYEWRICINK